jgi:dipeptidyl aminopeptidase/acylaminoacyl peptidase
MLPRTVLTAVALLALYSSMAPGAVYQKPAADILAVLYAPGTPAASISPAGDSMLLLEELRYPSIAEVGAPMLRLAALRINPKTNGPHLARSYVKFVLVHLADGRSVPLALLPNAKAGQPEWSPDGTRFAFTNTTPSGIELWVGETASGKVRRLPGLRVNAVYGETVQWMPDGRRLLVQLIPPERGNAPAEPSRRAGPRIQESSGKHDPVRTMPDALTSPYDELLFDYYATARLAIVDAVGGKAVPVGSAGIFESISPAPDGKHLLVARVQRPYSYLHAVARFPKTVEVWDSSGNTVHTLAKLPLTDQLPIDGVPSGPRHYQWHPTEPATLVWVEALDGGDPKTQARHRDRVLLLRAPFRDAPAEMARTAGRFRNLAWLEQGGQALLSDYDRNRRWTTTVLVRPDDPSSRPRTLWSLSAQDRYNTPGDPVKRTLPTGHRAVRQHQNSIFLIGDGASPEGDRPFLDRIDLETLQTKRIFRCEPGRYESIVALLPGNEMRFITRRESAAEPPNYHLRTARGGLKALTEFRDPTPELRRIRKQLVTYKRADGVPLSFTLYLPPGYREGTRLPAVAWAYPREYSDPGTAGQVSGSTHRFTAISGTSRLFLLLAGYAVLDNAAMPVVGDPETVNNTYVDQIVMNAQAAIDKAVEMGVADRARIAVAGHSYGAFMTANLLAHSDLFRAGIALSGAYNRTLTPFGFQAERRTLWEASDLYFKMSPFLHADRIKEPMLMFHGEADDNEGTYPIQSERMYHAIRGNGGTVRLVMLPHESHGYSARESIEHTLYEMIAWLDKYVKGAGHGLAASPSSR